MSPAADATVTVPDSGTVSAFVGVLVMGGAFLWWLVKQILKGGEIVAEIRKATEDNRATDKAIGVLRQDMTNQHAHILDRIEHVLAAVNLMAVRQEGHDKRLDALEEKV